jgi:hypothetical protein
MQLDDLPPGIDLESEWAFRRGATGALLRALAAIDKASTLDEARAVIVEMRDEHLELQGIARDLLAGHRRVPTPI